MEVDEACGHSMDVGRDGTADAEPSKLSSEELIREFVPHHRVTAFAWSVIRHVVPSVSEHRTLHPDAPSLTAVGLETREQAFLAYGERLSSRTLFFLH